MLRFACDGLGFFGGSDTVVSCLPHCFFNLQTSKLFSGGDKESHSTSLSLGFTQSPHSDLQEAACKSPISMH